MKVPVIPESPFFKRHGPATLVDCSTRLFDLEGDPNQLAPTKDPVVERRLVRQMVGIMQANDAPRELYARFDLEVPAI